MSLVMRGHEYESGSCPWIYWNGTLHIGKNRESHWDLIRRMVPDDMATFTFMDDEDVVAGRVSLEFGQARGYNIYKLDRVPAEKQRAIAKEFDLTHG